MRWAHSIAAVSADHRLVVTAALADPPVAAIAWAEWRRFINFDDIDGPTQRLLPLIIRRVGVVPDHDEVRGRVRGMYRQAWVTNHRLWAQAGDVFDHLSDAGVPAMVLKGASLLPFYANDWGVRPMFDIDIAVPSAHMQTAIGVLRAAGWHTELGQSDPWLSVRMRRQRHSWGHERSELEHLDLHWRITSDVMWDGADDGWWEGARPIRIGDRSVSAMHPADILMHVLVHGTRGGNCPPVQWIADAAHIARAIEGDGSALRRWTERTRSVDLVLALRSALDVAIDVSADGSLRTLAAHLPTSVSLVDRLRMLPAPLAEIGAQVARDAAGGAGLRLGVVATLRRLTEIDLVTRPRVAMTEVVAGRPLWLGRMRRRIVGSLVQPPVQGPRVALPLQLDLADPSVLDRHGGAGWRLVMPDGTRTSGRWSYLAVSLATGHVPTEVVVELRATAGSVPVEIVVDNRVVGRTVTTTEPQAVVASVSNHTSPGGTVEIALRIGRRTWRLPRSTEPLAVSGVFLR